MKDEGSASAFAPPPLDALRTGSSSFAWLSLDEDDGDPAHFLTYLVAALQRVCDELGETAISLLQSPQPPPFQTIVAGLINEIASLQEQIVLVLDDYHAIENPAVHEAVAYLLDRLPPQLHLAIITRSDPPLPLSRLRVRGQMAEVRADDLRFSMEEATAFLNQIWGIDLDPEHVAALEARTEGWVAGLQLAALSMRRRHNRDDLATFVADFTGSHRYVLDYLADEVLRQQAPATQDFLLRSSIMDRLSSSLCDAVLETGGSQAMLEALEAANLFIVPLDNRRRWYRYHHLFADLLRHRLKLSQPGLLPGLHRRASHWYEQHDLMGQAIAHALAADDAKRAATLVEKARWEIHGRGEIVTLRRWLRSLPTALVDSSGALAMTHVWTLLYEGKVAEAEAYLNRVTPALNEAAAKTGGAAAPTWRGEMAVLQAQMALNHGDVERSIVYCLQARQEIPAGSLIVRSIAEILLGHGYRAQGKLETAFQAYAAAAAISAETGNRFAVLSAMISQAWLREVQGCLHQAEAIQQKALAVAQDRQGRLVPLAGIPLTGLGRLYREWNRTDEATRHLEDAVRLGRQAGLGAVVMDSAITLSLIRLDQGDGDGAHAVLREVEEVIQRAQVPLVDLRLSAAEARLWLAQGNLETAAAWAEQFMAEYGNKHVAEPGDWFDLEHTVLARIWLAQGKLAETQALLAELLSSAEAAAAIGRIIKILALQALVQQAQGESDRAAETLARALTLALPEGYVRVFVDEGRPMGELLARVALEQSEVAGYATQLLAAFENSSGANAAAEDDGAPEEAAAAPDLAQWLAEPLSERELEVLRLVAEGLSNREIGRRLFISISTVKKHVENIHGKLYVRKRTQAVARARELGLL